MYFTEEAAYQQGKDGNGRLRHLEVDTGIDQATQEKIIRIR